jgi:hypothetical protein
MGVISGTADLMRSCMEAERAQHPFMIALFPCCPPMSVSGAFAGRENQEDAPNHIRCIEVRSDREESCRDWNLNAGLSPVSRLGIGIAFLPADGRCAGQKPFIGIERTSKQR